MFLPIGPKDMGLQAVVPEVCGDYRGRKLGDRRLGDTTQVLTISYAI